MWLITKHHEMKFLNIHEKYANRDTHNGNLTKTRILKTFIYFLFKYYL